jgi:hypothetical protein
MNPAACRLVLSLGCLAALGACQLPHTSPEPASTIAFSVGQDYEGAYRRVLENARRCWPANSQAGQRDIDGTLDNTARHGRIALAFRSRDRVDTRLEVDLQATERARTDVRIVGAADATRPADIIRGWLEGTSLDCP